MPYRKEPLERLPAMVQRGAQSLIKTDNRHNELEHD